MKTLSAVFLLAILAARSGSASILIDLDQSLLTGLPGDTLVFTGTISNTGGSTIYFNSFTLNLSGSSFLPDGDGPFLSASFPASLDAGNASGDIELFQVTILSPFTDGLGIFDGAYTLLGGDDGAAQNSLAVAPYQVQVVPEPGTGALVVIAALLAVRRIRQKTAGAVTNRPPSSPPAWWQTSRH
jgi:hypothetical protein